MRGLFFAILGWSAGRCCRLLRLHLAPFQHREGFRMSKTRPPLFRVLSSLDSQKIIRASQQIPSGITKTKVQQS